MLNYCSNQRTAWYSIVTKKTRYVIFWVIWSSTKLNGRKNKCNDALCEESFMTFMTRKNNVHNFLNYFLSHNKLRPISMVIFLNKVAVYLYVKSLTPLQGPLHLPVMRSYSGISTDKSCVHINHGKCLKNREQRLRLTNRSTEEDFVQKLIQL